MAKRLAQFADAEKKAWQHAFAFYVDHGMAETQADAAAWADLQGQFPRLKAYDGAEPIVVKDRFVGSVKFLDIGDGSTRRVKTIRDAPSYAASEME